jgi:hypothetical protein
MAKSKSASKIIAGFGFKPKKIKRNLFLLGVGLQSNS